MALEDLLGPFFEVRLFRNLAPNELKLVALVAEPVSFAPGEAIISRGETGNAAYLIVEGTAKVLRHGARTGQDAAAPEQASPELLPAGTFIGEMAMVIETRHLNDVVAHEGVNALAFRRPAMHDLMAREPAIAQKFMAQLRKDLLRMAEDLRAVEEALAPRQLQQAG